MAVDLVAAEGRVDGAVADERDADEPRQQVVHGRLHVTLAEPLDHLLAQVQRLGHVDRDSELEDRRRPRLGEPARDRPARPGHRHDLDVGLGCAAPRGRGRRRASDRGVLDVVGHDAPVRARAGERRQVDAALARDPARERGCLDPPARGLGGRRYGSCPSPAAGASVAAAAVGSCLPRRPARRSRLAAAALWRRCLGSVAVLDHRDRRADLDLAFLDDDLEQDAVEIRLDLLRDLVGVELVERLALLDAVALGLEPAHDRAGLHALSEPGQLDLGRHQHTLPRRADVAPCGSLATVTMDAIMLKPR